MNVKTPAGSAAAACLGLLCASANGWAQTGPAAAPPAFASTAAPTGERAEPAVRYTVIEDESARIDEMRVRGQTQRITVTPKRAGVVGNRPYQIIGPGGSQDLQEAPNGAKGAAGQRVWQVMSF